MPNRLKPGADESSALCNSSHETGRRRHVGKAQVEGPPVLDDPSGRGEHAADVLASPFSGGSAESQLLRLTEFVRQAYRDACACMTAADEGPSHGG